MIMNTQQLSLAAHTLNIHIKIGESAEEEERGRHEWDDSKRK